MPTRTYTIQTLGCRVNQYEAEQLATLLQSRGLVPAQSDAAADLKLVHTCSVTVQAAGKSRQTARRSALSLKVLTESGPPAEPASSIHAAQIATGNPAASGGRVILTGCWATSDPAAARAIPGVDAVITHHDDVATEIDQLLHEWKFDRETASADISLSDLRKPGGGCREEHNSPADPSHFTSPREQRAGEWAGNDTAINRPISLIPVNEKIAQVAPRRGFATLPLLGQHQTGRQRALLKIQDGCDAHCTYCIIPQLRPTLWSKPIDDTVDEARRLVDSGHVELVLTGIFLGAYGHTTALRRRQKLNDEDREMDAGGADLSVRLQRSSLSRLVDALCTRVPGLRRLRLSSLEPGDLTGDLLAALRSHEQVVPHFHLPLQSGSARLLRKMNRQYGRDDFLRMADDVRNAFDRPALTTDVIAGFPGEDDAAFEETADVVRRVGFIHVHAFHFSPRPKTAAARWQKEFVRGPVVGQRIDALRAIADENSLSFRRSFIGEEVELLVEHDHATTDGSLRHGRSERYFEVWFDAPKAKPGDFARVRVDEVTATRTRGTLLLPLPCTQGLGLG